MHFLRNSLHYVNWKERKAVAADLRQIYRSATLEEAEQQLAAFEQAWSRKYASVSQLWRQHGSGVAPLFAFPEEIRRVIDTTNAVESLNMTLRRVIKTRASFPSEDAALKLLYLALQNLTRKWKPTPNWRTALNHFMLLWGERLEVAQQRPTR